MYYFYLYMSIIAGVYMAILISLIYIYDSLDKCVAQLKRFNDREEKEKCK
jgi:hypothetical protein